MEGVSAAVERWRRAVRDDLTARYAGPLRYDRLDAISIRSAWAVAALVVLLAFLALTDPPLAGRRTLEPSEAVAAAVVGLVAAALPARLDALRARAHYAWRVILTVGLTVLVYLLVFTLGNAYGVAGAFFILCGYVTLYADWRLPWVVFGLAAVNHLTLAAVAPGWAGPSPWGGAEATVRLAGLGVAAAVTSSIARLHLTSVADLEDARDALERDAARHRQVESALRANEERLSTVLDALPHGVLILGSDGRVLLANAAASKTLGASRYELMRRKATDPAWGLRPSGGRRWNSGLPFAEVMRSGQAVPGIECEVDSAEGRRIVSADLVPLRDGTGAATAVIVAFEDVTLRKRDAEELEATRRQLAVSEKMSALGSLVSGVAHEIRTPLTYIQNNMYVLRARLTRFAQAEPHLAPSMRDAVELIEAALEGSGRINHLVNDLRRFTRAQPGEASLAPVHEVVGGAVELFKATHRGELELIADLHATLPCELDRVQIQQVVLNLLDNASDAVRHRGYVRVATRPAAGGAEILVEDRGPGIPQELHSRIFDEFFTTKSDGTGLGLAIIRRIVADHGGTIRCESELGRGTRFVVWLPTRRGTATSVPVAGTPETAARRR